jgi:hypothetical protein
VRGMQGSTNVLRRRRRDSADQQRPHEYSSEGGVGFGSGGPWDIADDYPEAERIDCGSLLVPVREGFEVQINVAEEQGAWVAIVQGENGMQLQAFAAPRGGGLWDEVRHEIAVNIADSGGSWQESEGRAGVELHGRVPVGNEHGTSEAPQPVRFLGFDGPRWFLRGVISGPAATDAAAGDAFYDLFAGVVVVRGDYPAPPREMLEIRLPEEARQALEAQLAEEGQGWGLADPFTRGPEITETR